MRFSIAKLLFATAVVAVFLGLRNGYVFGFHTDLRTTVERAWWATWIMSVVVSAIGCAQAPLDTPRRMIVVNATLAGGLAAAISAAILGFEIAEGIHAAYPDYWRWGFDYLYFAVFFVGRGLLFGAAIGAIIGSIWGVSSPRRRNAAKVNESR